MCYSVIGTLVCYTVIGRPFIGPSMYFWMIGQYCAVQWLVHQQSALHHCAVFSLPICYTVIAPQMCYDWSTGLLLSDWSIDVILIDWSTSVLLCDWSIDVKLTDWFTSVLLSDWSIFVQHSDGSTSATFACHNSKQHYSERLPHAYEQTNKRALKLVCCHGKLFRWKTERVDSQTFYLLLLICHLTG